MNRREVLTLLGAAGVAWPVEAWAQQSGRIVTIGFLTVGANFLRRDVLSQSLQALGWVEGKNTVFEFRGAENRPDRLPELVAELVDLKVDVIIAVGTLAPLAAKRATTTIPIVLGAAGDPIGSGLVTSLSRPGGNITGLSLMSPDLGGKRLEILRDVIPGVSRVATLWNAANPYPALVYRETEVAARTLGIQVLSLEVRGPDDFDSALEAAIRQQPMH
jgi:putative ABC transport system substrate-binding protein